LMVTDDGKNNDGCKNYAILNQHWIKNGEKDDH
jgi:hypothetical protein